MPVRLADIARHAGVSEATVSRVMNDRPGVAEPKRRAVLLALDSLGYDRPSRLRERTRRRVGIVLSDPVTAEGLDLAQHLVANFARRGLIATIAVVGAGGATADELVVAFEEMGCSAVVGIDLDDPAIDRLPERAALVGDAPASKRLAFVTPMSARLERAVHHLAEAGHQRIVVVSAPTTRPLDEPLPSRVIDAIVAPAGREAGEVAVRRAREGGATAIVTATAWQAIGVVEVTRAQSASGAPALPVIALAEDPLLTHPLCEITAVERPTSEIAVAAVDALVGDMNGIPAGLERFNFDPVVRVRASTLMKDFALH